MVVIVGLVVMCFFLVCREGCGERFRLKMFVCRREREDEREEREEREGIE